MDLRRLEEIGLNASGPINPRLYDGWLLGLAPGKAKRGRSVNPYYESVLPVAVKVEACRQLYAAAGLPLIVRLTPFAQPPELDAWLADHGYVRFDDTLVLVRPLDGWVRGARTVPPGSRLLELDLFDWAAETQEARSISNDESRRVLDRIGMLRLDGCGLLVRNSGELAAWGMTQIEDGFAGLYNIETAPKFRRAGLARQLVPALIDWAKQHGAGAAYLQVTAANAAALPLYEELGFTEGYRYWYRAQPELIANERR